MTEQVRSSKVAQKLVSSIVDGTRFMSVLQRDIEVKRAEIDRLTATVQIRFASIENNLMTCRCWSCSCRTIGWVAWRQT